MISDALFALLPSRAFVPPLNRFYGTVRFRSCTAEVYRVALSSKKKKKRRTKTISLPPRRTVRLSAVSPLEISRGSSSMVPTLSSSPRFDTRSRLTNDRRCRPANRAFDFSLSPRPGRITSHFVVVAAFSSSSSSSSVSIFGTFCARIFLCVGGGCSQKEKRKIHFFQNPVCHRKRAGVLC